MNNPIPLEGPDLCLCDFPLPWECGRPRPGACYCPPPVEEWQEASSFDRLIELKRAESEVIRDAFDAATARRQEVER